MQSARGKPTLKLSKQEIGAIKIGGKIVGSALKGLIVVDAKKGRRGLSSSVGLKKSGHHLKGTIFMTY